MRHLITALITIGLIAVPAAAVADHHGGKPASQNAPPTQAIIAARIAVLADPHRDADRARDQWRHPAQTLEFFKVDPGMTVVDYMPANGWWTRVLVPYLGTKGRYIGLNPDVRAASDRHKQSFGNLGASFPAKAAEWTGTPAERIFAFNSDTVPPALNGTADRVMISREIHNLWRFGWLRNELFSIRALLKPEGLLGIEQHRARPNAPTAYTDGSMGYLRQKDVIALIEAHGFELVAKSELNANPRDPANHLAGVWTLPPVFTLGDKDRANYVAIGESDRMTLLFRKRP